MTTTCNCGGKLFFRINIGRPPGTPYMICKDCVHMYRIDKEFESVIHDHGEKWDHKYAEDVIGYSIHAMILPTQHKNSILDLMVSP